MKNVSQVQKIGIMRIAVVYDDRVDGRKVRREMDGHDDRVDKNEEPEIRWGGEEADGGDASIRSIEFRPSSSVESRSRDHEIEMRVRQRRERQESTVGADGENREKEA